MPGQLSASTGRARGSWTPRLAGIGAAMLAAFGGAVAYIVISPAHAARDVQRLPTQVLSVQTVGLVARAGGASAGSANVGSASAGSASAGSGKAGSGARLLTESGGGLLFGAMPPADQPQGNPQWTADTMAGGTFVFIYVPTGECLGSVTHRHHAVLALRRCDLGPAQRWQRIGRATESGGHEYGQYRDLASGRCLTAGAAPGQADDPAVLARCDPGAPPRQLISFWWAA